MNDKQIAEQVAKILLRIKAISLNPLEPYRYSSGILSPIYTDCRLLMGYPKERDTVAELLAKKIKNENETFDLLAGTAMAAIPHTAFVAEKLIMPMVFIRTKAKDHGKQNKIEGVLRKGQNAAVIEDLISTGESSIGTVNVLRDAGVTADKIFAIFTYNLQQAALNFKQNDISMSPLTDFAMVIDVAVKEHYIDGKSEKMTREWNSNPSEWGRKMGFE